MGESDNWQLTTANCFSKSFQGPHTGCGWRRHNNLVLAIRWYSAGLAFRKCAGHISMWYSSRAALFHHFRYIHSVPKWEL